jgi:hypothetical protein
MKKTIISIFTIIVTASALTACHTVDTVLDHGQVQASNENSNTIFLKPVAPALKTVYVDVKNTSDKDLEVQNKVKGAITAHGYKVVSNPDRAHYILQANILKVSAMDRNESKRILERGYGAAVTGLASAGIAHAITESSNTALGAGIAGAALGMVADSLIKDINYAMVADIQVGERTNHVVHNQTKASLQNGLATSTTQSANDDSHFQYYRTRVVSNVNKMNLKYAEAKPVLEAGLARVVGGIL